MSNPIGWCDKTINCVTGCPGPDGNGPCSYCYAQKFAVRQAGKNGYPAGDHCFDPTFHPDKLQQIENLKGRGKRIFLDSMGDLFSPGVDPDWLHQIIDAVWKKDSHTFLVLTKRPDRILEMLHCNILPMNLWVGVSVTCQDDIWRIGKLREVLPNVAKFVSFEPLHGLIRDLDLACMEWVIIGAETGNRKGKITPEVEWVRLICYAARNGVPVFLKDNLQEVLSMRDRFPATEWPPVALRQQFPGVMEWGIK